MAAWNQSKIKTFRRCQKQFAFRYDTKPGQEMVRKVPRHALSLGSWMHELQRAHHRSWAGLDDDWEEVHEELTNRFSSSYFEEDRAELGDLPGDAERLFRAYLRFWGESEDSYKVATSPAGKPLVEVVVSTPLKAWGIEDPFKGRIDLGVEDLEYGGIWIWDHKWVKRIPGPDERMMSPQALLYVWALRRKGYDIRGFLFNYARKKAPTWPHTTKWGRLSVARKIDTDLYTWLLAMKDLHGKHWRKYARTYYYEKIQELKGREVLWFDRQRIPVEPDRIKEAVAEFIVSVRQVQRRPKHHVPRSYFYNCKFGCDYHDPCVAEANGMDIDGLIQRHYEFTKERYAKDEDLLAG